MNGTLIVFFGKGVSLYSNGDPQSRNVGCFGPITCFQILTELLKLAMLVTSLNQSYIVAGRIVQVFDEKSEELDQELDDVSVPDPQLALSDPRPCLTYPLAANHP